MRPRERQTSSDSAYGQARELARTAQFMREWSSGTQTDFTNYAARRLAERGLLREEDPIKLQRAVTEIAYSYARGGSCGNRLRSDRQPAGSVDSRCPRPWAGPIRRCASSTTRNARTADSSALRQQTATNEAEIRARQSRQRAVPNQSVGNDLAGRVSASEAEAKTKIDKGRTPDLAGRRHAQRELQGLGAHRQGQSQPRREPGRVGHGGRQREPARPRHSAQGRADRRVALRQGRCSCRRAGASTRSAGHETGSAFRQAR